MGNEGLVSVGVPSWSSAIGFLRMPRGCLEYFSLRAGFYSSQDHSSKEYTIKTSFLVLLSLKQVHSPTEVF